MTKNELTLVTAFFDLSKIDGSVSKPHDKYFDLADYIFKFNYNIVFFVEQKNYLKVWESRKKYNLLHKTLIISRELKELKYFDKYDEADKLVLNTNLQQQDRKKHTTSYLLFMYNKVELMDEIIKLNPFKSETFGWIDLGIDYITKGYDFSNILENPSVKVKVCEVVHIPKKEILDKKYHIISTKYVARTVGGFWIGNVIMMNIFISKFREWVKLLWENKLITYDENIYEIILQLHPEITEKYYGRYWYFFENWTMVKHYDIWFLKNMRSCRLHGENNQVVDMYKKLKIYQWNNMENADKWDVYYEVIISSFYVDKEIFIGCCEEFVSFLEDNRLDSELMLKLKNNSKIIISNLNFAKMDYDVRIYKLLN